MMKIFKWIFRAKIEIFFGVISKESQEKNFAFKIESILTRKIGKIKLANLKRISIKPD